MSTDRKLTVSTRSGWRRFLPGTADEDTVTGAMITLGVEEFLRYRGAVTVEVLVQGGDSVRRMLWWGIEETPVIRGNEA